MSVTAFAAGDPITVVNNLSDFIFGLIRAVGLILLGWGIVQVGLSFQTVSYTHLDVYKRQLERYLKDYPSIKTVHLHLDNDGIGRGAVAGIVSGLQEKYTVLDEPPLHGKDVNDCLLYTSIATSRTGSMGT